MEAVLRDRWTVIAALGAGVVVGVSGIYMYYKLNRNVTQELSNLAGTIESLKREIEELKVNHLDQRSRIPLTLQSIAAAPPSSVSSVRVGLEKSSDKRTVLSQYHLSVNSSVSDETDEVYYDFTDAEEGLDSWASVSKPFIQAKDEVKSNAAWIEEIDQKLDGDASQREEAYTALLARSAEFENKAEILWRLAKAAHLCGIIAEKRHDLEKKKELVKEAFNYASSALEADSSDPEVHKWYAITVGSLSNYGGLHEKVKNGYSFKEHVDLAVELKPDDPTLHHMLGRWCYEIAMLTWWERKIASTLGSPPPESSYEEARQHLLQADQLKPEWKENMLFIAKTYIGEGKYPQALSWIDRAIKGSCVREDDELAQLELLTLQNSYEKYRS
ncbi:regulator of microtubule dynamics protein 1-like isoform X1 [Tachypleus tridentatus]|uniref:regulator of microtubule dynamics protein 1-like isoform X1 n=1 Tax=Tachypleus tridentatus TaxID=6853 RepID=UPI003FD60F7B